MAEVIKAMIAIESRGNYYRANGNLIAREDRFSDELSIGVLHVKLKIWQWLVQDANAWTSEGDIRLGTANEELRIDSAPATLDFGQFSKPRVPCSL